VLDNVVRLHGLPTDIVSDRDPRLDSRFWRGLCERLGIKIHMSTAYHPQSDGQTEVTNKTLEQYLRHYVAHAQNDWDEYLTTAEIAYNNAIHATTKLAPFEVARGFRPNFVPPPAPLQQLQSVVPDVDAFTRRFDRLTQQARDAMHWAQVGQAKAANKSRAPVAFKVGQWVWLSSANYTDDTLGVSSRKLQQKWLGPFQITRVVSPGAYEVDLQGRFKFHNVLPVSALKLATTSEVFPDREPPRPPPEVDGGDEYYAVESILRHKGRGKRAQFLVKWKDYARHENSWEPLSEVEHLEAYDVYIASKGGRV